MQVVPDKHSTAEIVPIFRPVIRYYRIDDCAVVVMESQVGIDR